MGEWELRQRIDAVVDRVDLVSLVGAAVALSKAHNPRGKCPFHGSESDSLAVYPDKGRLRCWGCGWSGDAIKFVQDYFGVTFIEALKQLEQQNGLDGLTAAPVHREKRTRPRRGAPPIGSDEMGRILWSEAKVDLDPIRTYLHARGVPDHMLDADRLWNLRFHANAPIAAWVDGERDRVPTAPAMLASVTAIPAGGPQAVHATFLAPSLTDKMMRLGRDGQPMPPRKFLGTVDGGGVIFGEMTPSAPIFAAEGIETLLSGMALLDAPPEAVGLALLSLENLQGGWLGVRRRGFGDALPLYDPEPNPASKAVAFAHDGPVTGLIDADMKPLKGPKDRDTGQHRGVPIIEHPGGPVVMRELRSAERSQLCAELFARRWRNAGCRRVQTLRPPMGSDFNDVAAQRTSTSFREAQAHG